MLSRNGGNFHGRCSCQQDDESFCDYFFLILLYIVFALDEDPFLAIVLIMVELLCYNFVVIVFGGFLIWFN